MQEIKEYEDEAVERPAWMAGNQAKVLLIGAGIGALTGLAAAFLLGRRASKTGGEVNVTPGDGIRIGLLVLGLLRSIGSLGTEEK
jgi:hypothetical protein